MPIRAENRARYPKDWPAISARVREESGQRCEWCNAPNGAMIVRGSDNQGAASLPAWRFAGASVYDRTFNACTGEPIPGANWDTFDANTKGPVKVILTVAHLDHQPENCARENLRALCQRCHNDYDAPMRRAGIRERERDKMAAGDLFP